MISEDKSKALKRAITYLLEDVTAASLEAIVEELADRPMESEPLFPGHVHSGTWVPTVDDVRSCLGQMLAAGQLIATFGLLDRTRRG